MQDQHRLARRTGLLAALLAAPLLACSGNGGEVPPPPDYVAPEPGTIYNYRGIANRIVSVDGLRTRYIDHLGREGSRLALFITESPDQPAQVDSAALASLWPLEPGKELRFIVQRGQEQWEWEYRVNGVEAIDTPAGIFDAYVVQAVEVPKLVRDPASAATVVHTWWYAPEIRAVARFRSNYIGGPAAGRVVEGDLLGIERPAEGEESEG